MPKSPENRRRREKQRRPTSGENWLETGEVSESPDSAHVRVHHRGQAVGDGDARQAPAHGEVQRVQGGLPAAPVDFGPAEVEFRTCVAKI